MWTEHEQRLNEAAHDRMKGELDATFPDKQWVAFGGGEVIGDDADFFALVGKIRATGRDPRACMVVRVGDEEPVAAAILTPFPVHS